MLQCLLEEGNFSSEFCRKLRKWDFFVDFASFKLQRHHKSHWSMSTFCPAPSPTFKELGLKPLIALHCPHLGPLGKTPLLLVLIHRSARCQTTPVVAPFASDFLKRRKESSGNGEQVQMNPGIIGFMCMHVVSWSKVIATVANTLFMYIWAGMVIHIQPLKRIPDSGCRNYC